MNKLFSVVVVLLVAVAAYAGTVDRTAAQAKAKQFLESRGKTINFSKNVQPMRVQASTADAPKVYFHIFNADNNDGFVVVSADDRTPEIIGYTDRGEFAEDGMPENMRSWMQHYADEMDWLESHPEYALTAADKGSAPQKPRHSIAPILTCLWNQGEPYNDKCPYHYNRDGSIAGRSATGCVATAIAQVLYFHQFPAKTKKRIPAMSSNGQTLPAITAGTAIDWANMCDTYDGDEPQAAKDAVAQLMLIVGQALKMNYGPSSASSYADSRKLFVDYLGFDDGVQILRSDNFGIDEWHDMIYGELAKGYPVGYGGSSTGGGHAFVIDGYDRDDLFHVNWGWGGGSNGYFRLSVLNSDDNSGIGASSSADGYSMAQDAIMYLRSEDDGVPYEPENAPHLTINDTEVDGTDIFSNYINWTGSHNSFHAGIMEMGDDGELTLVDSYGPFDLDNNYYRGITFHMNGRLTAGKHILTPASKVATAEKWVPLYDGQWEYIEATVGDDGTTTVEKVKVPNGLEVTEWSFPGSLKVGEQQTVNISIANNGQEFKREVALYASKTSDKGTSTCRALIGIREGDADEFAFYFTPYETGTYHIWLTLNEDNSQVIGETTVEIGTTAKNKANLEVSSVSVPSNGYGNFLKGTMTVKNNARTDFKGFVKVQWWRDGGNGYWYSGSSQNVYYEIAAGKTATADFDFDNLEIGSNYRLLQKYTTQDEALTGGDLFEGSQWELKPGAVVWTKDATIAGVSVGSSYRASSSAAGIRFYGNTPTKVYASTNDNAIYAFEEGATVPTGLEGKNVVVGDEAEEINLTASDATYFPKTFTAKKATLAFPIDAACDCKSGWQAVALPFAPTRMTIDGEEVTWKHGDYDGNFWIKQFDEVNSDGEVVFCNAAQLRNATPYLMGFPADMKGKTLVMEAENVKFEPTTASKMMESTRDYNFVGTTYMPRLDEVYIMNESGTAFVYTEVAASIEAFSSYFTTRLDPAAAEIPLKFSDETTGVATIESDGTNRDATYDLQGRRIGMPTKRGIYIVGGRKVVK